MKKHTQLSLLLLFFTPLFAHATIIETSKNPDVAAGLVTYLSDTGWPTPQQDPAFYSQVPDVQTIFTQNAPVRVAQSISLADLNPTDDDNGFAAWDLNSLLWVVDWWAPSNFTATPTGSNVVSYAWADQSADILAGKTQISFFTDLYVPLNNFPLEEGEWIVASYFENETAYRFTSFQVVPEPITFLLFAGGLLILIARKHSHKVA